MTDAPSTAHWLYISGRGGAYHEQLDAHAPPEASDADRYRHRTRDASPDNNHGQWVAGRAPGGWK